MRRASLARYGLTRAQHLELKDLSRQCVMLRVGAVLFGTSTWQGKCQRCVRLQFLQRAHIYSEGGFPHMRYMPTNALALCEACHLFWWHREASEQQRLDLVLALLGPHDTARLAIYARGEQPDDALFGEFGAAADRYVRIRDQLLKLRSVLSHGGL